MTQEPVTGRGIPGSRSATDPERMLPRGRHDLPREFIARTQRDRLIDAMARTVAAKGYAAASLGDGLSVLESLRLWWALQTWLS